MIDRARAPRTLPHFVRRDRDVYFLASRRPFLTLNDADVELFDALDGTRTFDELGDAVAPRIEDWQRRGLVVALPREKPASGGPHVVVVEPHMDDAALSLGGVLAKKRGRARVTIVSVVRESSFTSYSMQDRLDFTDVETVTALRSTEASLAAQMLGAETRVVGEVDALLRFTRSRGCEDVPLSRLDGVLRAWMRFGPTDAEVDALAGALGKILRELRPDELWVPLGAGGHVDHVRTREACLSLVARGEAIAPRILFYADVPHVGRYPDQPEHIARALRDYGGELRRASEDVTDVFGEKLELVSVYASQFKMSFIEPLLVKHAEAAAGGAGGRAEAFYELGTSPRAVPPRRLTSTQPARIDAVREKLLAWEAVRDLLVIAAVPIGDKARLVETLSKRFTHASLEVLEDASLALLANDREAKGAHVLWIGDAKEESARRIVAPAAADVVLALA